MRPDIQHDIRLAPFTTFGFDVRAKHFVRIDSVDALRALREDPVWTREPRFMLGGGSNVLFTRDFDGLVVRIDNKGVEHVGHDGDAHLVAAAAGEDWDGSFARRSSAAGRASRTSSRFPARSARRRCRTSARTGSKWRRASRGSTRSKSRPAKRGG